MHGNVFQCHLSRMHLLPQIAKCIGQVTNLACLYVRKLCHFLTLRFGFQTARHLGNRPDEIQLQHNVAKRTDYQQEQGHAPQ